ncbi:MAG: flagellar hook-basal body complex protein FliE [Opitutaceae bacterium]|nr:flagellar hook-basal body complex protein FliE [Opitutaceae bacterium]
MSPLASVNPVLNASPLLRTEGVQPRMPAALPDDLRAAPPSGGFGSMLEGLVSTVGTKEAQAAELTRSVLLGDSNQLHQSVIAMQEASVAFSLMVEVRNKLVDSYQELMRMQV